MSNEVSKALEMVWAVFIGAFLVTFFVVTHYPASSIAATFLCAVWSVVLGVCLAAILVEYYNPTGE